MPRPNLNEILHYYPEISGVHPACTAVPDISDDDYQGLLDSIKSRGLMHDIILTEDGQLLDGRNRLIASFEANLEVRFDTTGVNPWEYACDANLARRHLNTYQKAAFASVWREHEEQAAQGRMSVRKGDQPGAGKCGNVSTVEDAGKSRDKAASRVGISGKSLDKFRDVQEYAPPEVVAKAAAGDISLEAAYKEAVKEKKQRVEPEKPAKLTQDTVSIVTHLGVLSDIAKPKTVRFNQTNDSVDWANWTWNPITGCLHGCKFCYAREIANSERMKDYYPNKFEPTFHEYRLSAPRNTLVPKSGDERDGRVFVCSMADLFGKWVPDEWIEKVFASCLEAPEWEYMFLTKWPNRYSQMPLLPKAWYGASVVQQSDVARVESAMAAFETPCVKWVSMEPMLTPVQFNDLSWCDLMVIGAQTSTTQPEGYVPAFSPEFDWIVDVVNQCRKWDVPYYLKENLLTAPGMRIPKNSPRSHRR